MTGAMRSTFRSVLALIGGLFVGIGLETVEQTGINLWERAHHDAAPILTPEGVAMFSIFYGLEYGAIIILVSVPAWVLLARFGRKLMADAANLGFVMTVAVVAIMGHRTIYDFASATQYVVFGLAGAAAGVTTWLIAHPRSRVAQRGQGRVALGRPAQ